MSRSSLVGFLEGTWTLQRRYADAAAGMTGSMTGVGRFLPEPGELRYVERGRLVLGAYTGEATRCYRWIPEQGWRAAVLFESGQPFHTLDLASGHAAVTHQCGADRYAGSYRVLDDMQWTVGWRIAGPRKALSIETRYTRA